MTKYNKLVRDRIPEIILEDGKQPVIHTADELEFKQKLIEKLQEETAEFQKNPTIEELADIQEVVNALGEVLGISKEELEKIRKKKQEERSGFNKRIILDEVK